MIGAEGLEQACVILDVKLFALPQYKPHLCLNSSVQGVILTKNPCLPVYDCVYVFLCICGSVFV